MHMRVCACVCVCAGTTHSGVCACMFVYVKERKGGGTEQAQFSSVLFSLVSSFHSQFFLSAASSSPCKATNVSTQSASRSNSIQIHLAPAHTGRSGDGAHASVGVWSRASHSSTDVHSITHAHHYKLASSETLPRTDGA